MGKVNVELSMSLDGFVAGPNDGPENPMGGGPVELERTRVVDAPGVTHLLYSV